MLMKFRISVCFFLSLIIFSIGCGKSSVNPVTQEKQFVSLGPEYVPGEVVVGFADSVSYPFVVSFVKSIQLEAQSLYIDSSFSQWIQFENSDAEACIKKISLVKSVVWVDQRGAPPYDSANSGRMYLLAHFDGSFSSGSIKNQINSFEGMTVRYTVFTPKFAVLKVEPGSELEWCGRLVKYGFIKYAERNAIMHTT